MDNEKKQPNMYKIIFLQEDIIYEIYAAKIAESNIFGFLEVEEFSFGEHTSLVVDPSEERLKLEFADVKRTYIPMHEILRIDEVKKEGVSKITESKNLGGNVSKFPNNVYRKTDKTDKK